MSSSSKKPSIEEAHDIIRNCMAENGLDYKKLAVEIGERSDKISTAITCSTGSVAHAVRIRMKVAKALGLDPVELWSEELLTPRKRSYSKDPRSVVPASEYSKKEWEQLEPRFRIRAIARERNTSMPELADDLGVSYQTLMNSVYGRTVSDELRLEIAAILRVAYHHIWPEGSIPGARDDQLRQSAANHRKIDLKDPANRAVFLGSGNL